MPIGAVTDRRRVKCQMRRNRHDAVRQANIDAAYLNQVTDPQRQIKKLDFRLGIGKGAKRERAKLHSRIKLESVNLSS
jgi:hypothetical protein